MTTESKDALSIEIKRMSDQLHESFDRQFALIAIETGKFMPSLAFSGEKAAQCLDRSRPYVTNTLRKTGMIQPWNPDGKEINKIGRGGSYSFTIEELVHYIIRAKLMSQGYTKQEIDGRLKG